MNIKIILEIITKVLGLLTSYSEQKKKKQKKLLKICKGHKIMLKTRLKFVIVAMSFILLLTSCALTDIIGITGRQTDVDAACTVFRPITYSSEKDSPETIVQIRKHNDVYETYCKDYVEQEETTTNE